MSVLLFSLSTPPPSSPPPSDHSLSPRTSTVESQNEKDSTTQHNQHGLLLTHAAIPAILEKFELEPGATGDLCRALDQAGVRTGAGKVKS